MICPECKQEVFDGVDICEKCNFDLRMYRQAYDRIYNEKLRKLSEAENPKVEQQVEYRTISVRDEGVHKPRCPYCNSENLTRITSFDKAVNIALFGILGNKRKYQWHCNNCKTNW